MSAPDRYFTGLSQEKVGDGYINKTSAMENSETSAVGRALAMMGIGVIDSIASVDEVRKAENRSPRENETGKVMINKEDAQLMKDAIEMYPEDKFLKSVGAKLKQYGKLTDNQRKAVEEKIGLAEIDTAVQDEVNAELDMEMEEISKNW